MKVIGFGHEKRVGKDTAADILYKYLSKKYPDKFIMRRSFATAMKDVAHKVYGWAGLLPGKSYEGVGSNDKDMIIPLLGKSARQIWIEIGMAFRGIHTDTWVKLALNASNVDYVIISDIRFQNEFDAIKAVDGLCIKVVRETGTKGQMDQADSALSMCTGWHSEIQNNGTLDDLRESVIRLCNQEGL